SARWPASPGSARSPIPTATPSSSSSTSAAESRSARRRVAGASYAGAVETCEWCGNPLPPGARFCPTCGAPVASLQADVGLAPDSVDGVGSITERKLVTVLFADLVRSTELAAELDPERYSEVMAAFFQMVERELSSLRGRTEKFV